MTSIGLNNITVMKYAALKGCSALEAINAENLINTWHGAFGGCTSLRYAVNMKSLTTYDGEAGNGAFTGCTSLKCSIHYELFIKMGKSCYEKCSALEALIFKCITPPTFDSYALNHTNDSFVIYVPDKSVSAYQGATNWIKYANRIMGLDSLPSNNPDLYEEIKNYL